MIPPAKETTPGGFNPIHFTVLCLSLLTLRVCFTINQVFPYSELTLIDSLRGPYMSNKASPWTMVHSLHTPQTEASGCYWSKDLLHRQPAQEVWPCSSTLPQRSWRCRPRCFQRDSQDWHEVHEKRVVPTIGQLSQGRRFHHARSPRTWAEEKATVALV